MKGLFAVTVINAIPAILAYTPPFDANAARSTTVELLLSQVRSNESSGITSPMKFLTSAVSMVDSEMLRAAVSGVREIEYAASMAPPHIVE